MKAMRAIPLAAALALSAGGAVGQEQAPASKAGEGEVRSCLSNASILSRRVEDARTLRFETTGGRVYRNRLSGPCPGFSQAESGFGSLAFELHGDSLCRGDLVRVVDPARGGTMTLRTAPACPLGSFERLPDPPARRR